MYNTCLYVCVRESLTVFYVRTFNIHFMSLYIYFCSRCLRVFLFYGEKKNIVSYYMNVFIIINADSHKKT